jgi:hypothetical protein
MSENVEIIKPGVAEVNEMEDYKNFNDKDQELIKVYLE